MRRLTSLALAAAILMTLAFPVVGGESESPEATFEVSQVGDLLDWLTDSLESVWTWPGAANHPERTLGREAGSPPAPTQSSDDGNGADEGLPELGPVGDPHG